MVPGKGLLVLGRAPEHEQALARDHLRWALAPLGRLQARGGFYGALARLTAELVDELAPGS